MIKIRRIKEEEKITIVEVMGNNIIFIFYNIYLFILYSTLIYPNTNIDKYNKILLDIIFLINNLVYLYYFLTDLLKSASPFIVDYSFNKEKEDEVNSGEIDERKKSIYTFKLALLIFSTIILLTTLFFEYKA